MGAGSQGVYEALKKLFVTDKDGYITDLPCSSIGTLADVTAAAAATRIIVASTACRSVVVRSLGANTGSIRVGDSNVSASRGQEIAPGDAVVFAIDNVNLVYVYGNGTDKVSVTYVS